MAFPIDLVLGLLAGTLTLILFLVYNLISSIYCFGYAYAPFRFLKRYGIKGPPPTPFLGHYKDRVTKSALEHDQFLYEKYGPVSGFYIGQQPNILIADLDILKQIMVKEFDNFTDHAPFPNPLPDVFESKDVFTTEGEAWRKMRRTLSPSFSASKMKMVISSLHSLVPRPLKEETMIATGHITIVNVNSQMVPLIKRSTDSLVAVIGEKATAKVTFEAVEVYSRFTLEAIVATAFGRQINLQRGESDEFSKAMDTAMKGFASGQFESFVLINSHFPWLMKMMGGIFSYTEMAKAMNYVAKVARDLIKARRESGHTEKHKDLLQLMIEASGEEGDSDEEKETTEPPAECPAHKAAPTKTAKAAGMTDSEVFENAVGFLSAGNETTSMLLSYTSYLLALNPDVQEKLQSEIDAYFEDNPDSILYKAAQDITYLDNILQESLRIYPPAVETDRYCKRKTVINGVTIPKGAIIAVPISLLQHSPLYWKDPEKFDPDRFTPEEKAKRPQLCHMPFGFGPRICIGMRLALLEAKIALIELLKRYTFIRAPETEVPLQPGVGVSLRPKNGIYLRVKERAV